MLKSLALTASLLVAGVGLSGCTDGYGYGGVGYASDYYGGPGYGYDDYGYGGAGYGGAGYGYYDGYYGGGFGAPYWGWYGDYYYPGTGFYVYDRYRRPHRWNGDQQRYWSGRWNGWRGDRNGRRDDWRGFDRNNGYGRPGWNGGAAPGAVNPGGRPDLGWKSRPGGDWRQRGGMTPPQYQGQRPQGVTPAAPSAGQRSFGGGNRGWGGRGGWGGRSGGNRQRH